MIGPLRHLVSWASLVLVLLVAPTARTAEDSSGKYYNQFSVCDDSHIVVKDISLLCDSPGTYYYGSGKYRNSASCKAGDKAKVQVVFYIAEDLTDKYDPIYVDMFVSGYGTVESKVIYQEANLCEIEKMKAINGDVCPADGEYVLYYTYHWGSQSDEYEYSFVPKVSIGFTSNPNKGIYDLGGANTNRCSGDTFTNWTKGVRKSAANTIKTFLATFGILLCAVLAVCLSGWLIMRQARTQQRDVVIDDPLDDNEKHKVALVGDSKNNLLDIS